MKILITGGTGYLGGRLVQYFSKQQIHEIVVGTRQSTGIAFVPAGVKTVQTIWDSPEKLQQICTGIDAVIHLAGMNADDCAANPVAALESNAVATGKLINAAVKQGVKRFIYFSTAHIYKSPLVGVITEETLPTSLHPYATSHKAAEDMVRAAHIRGEIEGVVIRLSNAFGAPVNKEANCWMLLVNDLCKQAVTTGAMVLRSSGIQRRDFITIADVCRATEHLLQLTIGTSDKNVFNVGGNWSPTVWELACLIQKHCIPIMGFEPTLTRVEPIAGVKTEDLTYSIARLLQTGFTLSSNREEEIDRLLAFCNGSFS